MKPCFGRFKPRLKLIKFGNGSKTGLNSDFIGEGKRNEYVPPTPNLDIRDLTSFILGLVGTAW